MRKSRVLTLSLAIALIGGLIVVWYSARPKPEVALEALHDWRGKALSELGDAQQEKMIATIKVLVPEREYRGWIDFRPWYVWDFPNKGQPNVVLFEVNNRLPTPGSTGIRLTVFEETGKVRFESEFWTGHRHYMSDASLRKQIGADDPLIELEVSGLGGNILEKQIYARIGDRFDLVRLEDADGKATRNRYYIGHFACGPILPEQTAAEWEADVFAGDRLRTLRALVWLGGAHWQGKLPEEPHPQYEGTEQIELVRSVRADRRVAEKLKTFVKSDDVWIREAAALAVDPKDTRWGR
jgi:hypothetical protein